MKLINTLNTAVLISRSLKLLALVPVFLFFVSCSDNGCIEPDDFGEYQTQTLEIKSSTSFDSCDFDRDNMTDLRASSHGSGLTQCLTASNVTLFDAQGGRHTSDGQGCAKWQPLTENGTSNPHSNPEVMGYCVSECMSNCNSRLTGGATNPNPPWKSTDEREGNGSVTLKPGSEISVRATGSVTLGGLIQKGEIYLNLGADGFLPSQETLSGSSYVDGNFRVSSGDVLNLKISGGFDDTGLQRETLANHSPSGPGYGDISSQTDAVKAKIRKAFDRVALYLDSTEAIPGGNGRAISNPFVHYSCNYLCPSGGKCMPNCTPDVSSIRSATGSSSPDDEIAQSFSAIHPIATAVGDNGGLILYTDQLVNAQNGYDFEPIMFNTAISGVCEDGYDCPIRNASQGRMVGDLSSPKNYSMVRSSQVSFRFLQDSCAGGMITVAVKNGPGAAADTIRTYDLTINETVSSGTWGPSSPSGAQGVPHISVESGQHIEISRRSPPPGAANPPPVSFSRNGNNIDCGRSLAMRYNEYYNLQVNKSGLISFANIPATAGNSSNCKLKFRIINPTGSFFGFSASSAQIQSAYDVAQSTPDLEADFYEYGDFNDATAEEYFFNGGLDVSPTFPTDINSKIYVRKGQVIRFAPESWDGMWNTGNGRVNCGTGTVMRIEPRPAFLCTGSGSLPTPNPSCIQRRNESGYVRGCEARTNACTENVGSSNYCPGAFDDTNACIGELTFDEPTDFLSPRTNGSGTPVAFDQASHSVESPPACMNAYSPRADGNGRVTSYEYDPVKAAKCHVCQTAIINAGHQVPFLDSQVDFCYNLENYQGKVSNISEIFYRMISHPWNNENTPIHPTVTKGAMVLNRFNVDSGNLGGFADNVEDYVIAADSDFYFGRDAKLLAFYIAGNDFTRNQITSAYGALPTSNFNQSTLTGGFKIKLSDYLTFSNGENLSVIFCKEDSSSSSACRNHDIPVQVATAPQPYIIGGDALNSFAFDNYGNLYRSSPPRAGKFNCDNVTEGDNYLCHCEGDFNTDNNESCSNASADTSSSCTEYGNCHYRLTFKINDPEATNCHVPSSTWANPLPCNATDPNAANACNGIKNYNNYYDTDVANTLNQVCTYNDLYPGGAFSPEACKKQFVCASKYSNNSGQYNVLVRVKNKSIEVSGLVDSIMDPVLEALDGSGTPGESGYRVGQVERVYTLIINDNYYNLVLRTSLVLMITFYGLSYLMGLTEGGTAEIITKVLKIAFVLFFVSDQGWYWFNQIFVSTFKEGTNQISFLMATAFDNSPQLRGAIQEGNYSDKSVLFSSIDKVLGLFFTGAVQKKISALLFSGLFGWLYILIIYYAFIAYIFAICTAVLVYLTAQVFISILFILGPIFFVFTLFEQTKEMFDKWLQNLIGFSLQQIFLLVTLSFFNMMMYEIIRNALGYRVCWDEVWTINIIIRVSLLSFWTIPNVPPLFDSQAEMGSSGRGEGIPSFFSILFIWIVAKLMKEFTEFMSNVAADIGGGIKATALSSGISQSAAKFRRAVGSSRFVTGIKRGISERTVQALDKKLFNSGKLADREREAKKQQDKLDLSNKKAMTKAGEAAINDYKKNYGANLATMSKEEQRNKLNSVRNEAMTEKGHEMGLKDDEIKRLKDDKGTKYRGDNLAGYLAARTAQKFKKGGSVSKSITEDDVDRSLTKKQARKALQRSDKEGREKMLKAVEKGDLYVKSGSRMNRDMTVSGPTVGESKEYKQAMKQLVSEGKLKSIRGGSAIRSIALKDEEKKMIRERMKENIVKDEESGLSKTSRVSTVASLKRTAMVQEALENKDTSSGLIRKSYIPGKSGYVAKYDTTRASKSELKQQLRAEVSQNRVANLSTQLNEKAESLSTKIEEQNKQEVAINKTIENIKSSDKFQTLKEHGELVNKRNRSTSENERLEELQAIVSKPEYAGLNDELNAGYQKKAELMNQRNANVSRLGQLRNEIDRVGDVDEIKSNADKVIEEYENEQTVEEGGVVRPKHSEEQYKKAKKASKAISEKTGKIMGKKSGVFNKSSSGKLNEFAEKYKEFATNNNPSEDSNADEAGSDVEDTSNSTARNDVAPREIAVDGASNDESET